MSTPPGRHEFSTWACPACGKTTLRWKDKRDRSIAGDPSIHTKLFHCESCGAQPYSEERLVGQWKKSYLPSNAPLQPAGGNKN